MLPSTTMTPPDDPTSPTLSISTTLTPTHSTAFLADSKGKQREVDLGYDDFDNIDDQPAVQSPNVVAYPPTNDEAAETRRIEENLRRWDAAERQRRKAARESEQPSPSLVADVSRKASLLWSAKRSRHKNDSSLGNHVALQSQENINTVPLDDINATPTPSPSPSPTPPLSRRDSTDPQNPFANPPNEPVSPFADPLSTVESPSSSALLSSPSRIDNPRPTLQPAEAFYSRTREPPGPPRPLGLPPPRTPPPRTGTPPGPTSAPSLSRGASSNDEEVKETRWWHEWLCGCSEGTDRGGEYQAGRTNPFE